MLILEIQIFYFCTFCVQATKFLEVNKILNVFHQQKVCARRWCNTGTPALVLIEMLRSP